MLDCYGPELNVCVKIIFNETRFRGKQTFGWTSHCAFILCILSKENVVLIS
jgi:hypothetical protein